MGMTMRSLKVDKLGKAKQPNKCFQLGYYRDVELSVSTEKDSRGLKSDVLMVGKKSYSHNHYSCICKGFR